MVVQVVWIHYDLFGTECPDYTLIKEDNCGHMQGDCKRRKGLRIIRKQWRQQLVRGDVMERKCLTCGQFGEKK